MRSKWDYTPFGEWCGICGVVSFTYLPGSSQHIVCIGIFTHTLAAFWTLIGYCKKISKPRIYFKRNLHDLRFNIMKSDENYKVFKCCLIVDTRCLIVSPTLISCGTPYRHSASLRAVWNFLNSASPRCGKFRYHTLLRLVTL